ncbi:MAG TPA: LPXTG cell wall anchor domain-containing protein [Gaiellaceae bacterium]|nr:LPXTG cell wall anchor domain-containing protein [Gaiellaceae bacterium]
MGIVNKRNAVLGWLTWSVGKRVAKRKAKSAVPAVEGGKPNKPAIAAAVAALAGTLLFWRKRKKRGGAADESV